jgi:hypothetical protein
MDSFRLIAQSAIHPGNLMLEDASGDCYVYFAATGELSTTPIEHSLAGAMLQSYEWTSTPDGEWMTLEQLHARSIGLLTRSEPDTGLAQPES